MSKEKTKKTVKKTVKNKKFSEGVLASDSKLYTYHTIDELLGEKIQNPFGTTDEKVFNENLANMNLQEMTEIGTKVGLRAVHDRRIMKDRLAREFRKTVAKVKVREESSKKNIKPRTLGHQSDIEKQILSEGI
jgi:hypothetical protein